MDCKDVKYYLNDYAKGFLLDEVRKEIHDHLNLCSSCVKAFDDLITNNPDLAFKQKDVRAGKKAIREKVQTRKRVDKKKPIEKFFAFVPGKKLNAESFTSNLKFTASKRFNSGWFVFLGIVLAIGLGIISAFSFFNSTSTNYSYVERLAGYPIIESRIISDQDVIRIGEKLITDSESSARLKLVSEGEIDIEPQSVIQIIEKPTSEYTLICSKGKIEARTWTVPKLFSIQTPSAFVKDFGSNYELSVNPKAETIIKVKTGWVLMEYKNRRVLLLLPSNTNCISDSSKGMGTPFSNEASNVFKESLQKLDFGKSNDSNLALILQESRQQDVITLFHLLKNLDLDSRGKVFDRMSALFEMPRGITRNGVVNGEKDMLEKIWTQLGIGSISLYQNL
jgi:hypothetical protein